jgi:hypothetical protein
MMIPGAVDGLRGRLDQITYSRDLLGIVSGEDMFEDDDEAEGMEMELTLVPGDLRGDCGGVVF